MWFNLQSEKQIFFMEKDVVIIGAGLTGLTAALQLRKRNLSVAVVEKSTRVGGQIQTLSENGFVFESGPNTGSGASAEIFELFEMLGDECQMEFARKESEKRLIWKNGAFHALPSGLWSGITTPLFTLGDKLRILGEPFRAKGNNPDESVASLAARRLGKSFVDYAVDPFLSGIYAGNAETLITRHALPKLYNLEQTYGSFIGGSIGKAREAKKSGQKPQPKGIFSAVGGLENLPRAMAKKTGSEHIFLSADTVSVTPDTETGAWKTSFTQNGKRVEITSRHVITTVGAYLLPDLLPFIDAEEMNKITNLRYAPIVQVAVGVKNRGAMRFDAFGGLVSSKDKEDVLGILFPSSCFAGRCPENGMLFSFFMGGMKRSEIIEMNDREITEKVVRQFHRMLGFPATQSPDLVHIFRHTHAIPQYELSSEARFNTVSALEKQFAGLHLAGNLRDGIGMAHRIAQGLKLGKELR